MTEHPIVEAFLERVDAQVGIWQQGKIRPKWLDVHEVRVEDCHGNPVYLRYYLDSRITPCYGDYMNNNDDPYIKYQKEQEEKWQ